MEPLTVFASAVGFIGCFHLLSTAVTAVNKGRHANGAATTKKRSDWYCFFSLSSLLGREWTPSDKRDNQDLSQEAIREEYRRRQQAQRSRLYAE